MLRRVNESFILELPLVVPRLKSTFLFKQTCHSWSQSHRPVKGFPLPLPRLTFWKVNRVFPLAPVLAVGESCVVITASPVGRRQNRVSVTLRDCVWSEWLKRCRCTHSPTPFQTLVATWALMFLLRAGDVDLHLGLEKSCLYFYFKKKNLPLVSWHFLLLPNQWKKIQIASLKNCKTSLKPIWKLLMKYGRALRINSESLLTLLIFTLWAVQRARTFYSASGLCVLSREPTVWRDTPDRDIYRTSPNQ